MLLLKEGVLPSTQPTWNYQTANRHYAHTLFVLVTSTMWRTWLLVLPRWTALSWLWLLLMVLCRKQRTHPAGPPGGCTHMVVFTWIKLTWLTILNCLISWKWDPWSAYFLLQFDGCQHPDHQRFCNWRSGPVKKMGERCWRADGNSWYLYPAASPLGWSIVPDVCRGMYSLSPGRGTVTWLPGRIERVVLK